MLEDLRRDLKKIHDDWERLLETDAHDKDVLKQMAADIKKLHEDACKETGKYKEQADLIDYLLTTPWGAPFVSEMTLLEAAEKLDTDTFSELAKYGHEMKSQIFTLYDKVLSEIPHS